MKQNVGGFDRTWRFIASPGFLLAGIFAPVSTTVQVVFFVLAALTFLTGYFNF